METNSPALQVRSRSTAAALVMTLITLSILVILLVGFLSTMLTERRAATAFEDTARVKLIAAGAVSHAIDILRTNIPEPARLSEGPDTAPGENWAVNPGRLTVIKDGLPIRYVPLHTGEVTALPEAPTPRDAESVDLNQPLPGDTVPAITGLAEDSSAPRPAMRVKWVNLQSDPSKPADATNKLAGRYAFWMDDECARLNFNTALGKPAPGQDAGYDAQLNAGFVTPEFTRGTNKMTSGASRIVPSWALGRPLSVNLDVLFSNPNQLLADSLLEHTFLQGYSRYPEAILDYVTFQGTAARTWFDGARYNLTAYSRSPEFNAFGRSRLFTTYVPLSLEGGPSYQQPFLYDPSGAYNGSTTQILNLNSLLGVFGFTAATTDDDGDSVLGGNVANKAQIEMLMAYLKRRWPGYNRSFLDKYGEAECRQISLNALLMARMATTQLTKTADLGKFTADYALRTTSVNFSPVKGTPEFQNGRTPARMYWRFPVSGKDKLFLPQTPGPHITEVRLYVRSVSPSPAPKNDATQLAGVTKPRYIEYRYEVEYYMHPFGPVVDLSYFPTRTDYFEVTAPSYAYKNKAISQQFGFATPDDDRTDVSWVNVNNRGNLIVAPPAGTPLGPTGSSVANRLVFSTKAFMIGVRPKAIPLIDSTTTPIDYSGFDPVPFDAAKASAVTVNIRFRPGMSTSNAPARPRQMIPLGETRDDTLKATFVVDLTQTKEQVYSWQIGDPRMSGDLAQWEAKVQGPGDPAATGTPGLQNVNEPGESAPEKSKYRYLQRAAVGSAVNSYALDRGDEYDTASRISSPGYWSLLHTGMQSGKPWRTLDFGAENRPASALNGNDTSPPDWLFLDLLGPTFPMSSDQWKLEQHQPDQFSTASYMNSTAGQINLNSRIYPRTKYFNPPERTKPLQAVFQYLPGLNAEQIAGQISSYQSDSQIFDYVGELANVAAVSPDASTPWKRELALRNMAGVLTTKSNTFGVWGVAQAVKKIPNNRTYDHFERGDEILAEKRFYALVERYVWPGRDGIPGNGHVNPGSGKWDRLAQQATSIVASATAPDTLFQLPGSPPLVLSGQRLNLDVTGAYAEFDGPERVGMDATTKAALGSVTYRQSSLEDAYNPPQAAIKYRVVSFKYLDQ